MPAANQDSRPDPKADMNQVDRQVPVTVLERLHVKRAIELYIKSLERSRNNELPGSDIWRLRGADIDVNKVLLGKFS